MRPATGLEGRAMNLRFGGNSRAEAQRRRGFFWQALCAAVLLAVGCSEGRTPEQAQDQVPEQVDEQPAGETPACVRQCAGRQCGEDGCGGLCGECASGETCSQTGRCTAEVAGGCSDTCEDLGYECGEVCGEVCGVCGGGLFCDDGLCVCKPTCTAAGCGGDDGCGGACGPCPTAQSCEGCPLILSVVDRELGPDGLSALTLAVDFAASEPAPAPAMADLRLAVEGGVRLERVGITPSLLAAGKTLLRHPYTGKRFQVDQNGVHRFVLISSSGKRETKIPTGRWLLLRFVFEEPQAGSAAPAVFSLVQREDVFAPAAADLALQSEGYDGRVVVWREVAP